MRIPWYFVAPLAIAVFAGVLWLGAHNQDFTTPPNEAAIARSVKEWKRKHPPLPPRKRALPTTAPLAAAEVEPQQPSSPLIPAGNTTTSPNLEHFRDLQDVGCADLISLAIQLESNGNLAHALLAWERVLDSSDPSPEQSAQTRKAITALRAALPAWNADFDANVELVIHIHTPVEHKAEVSALLGQLSDDIRESSSYLVAPQVLLKTTQQREGFPTPPIRVWLSSVGENAKESPQLTLHVNAGEAPLGEQLYMAIYRSIAGQLQQTSELMPPASISATQTPRLSLTTNLTRLHWRDLCQSLHVAQEKKPPAVIIIEESSE